MIALFLSPLFALWVYSVVDTNEDSSFWWIVATLLVWPLGVLFAGLRFRNYGLTLFGILPFFFIAYSSVMHPIRPSYASSADIIFSSISAVVLFTSLPLLVFLYHREAIKVTKYKGKHAIIWLGAVVGCIFVVGFVLDSIITMLGGKSFGLGQLFGFTSAFLLCFFIRGYFMPKTISE